MSTISDQLRGLKLVDVTEGLNFVAFRANSIKIINNYYQPPHHSSVGATGVHRVSQPITQYQVELSGTIVLYVAPNSLTQ